MSQPVWIVPVTFYIHANTAEDAAMMAAGYLVEARCAGVHLPGGVAADCDVENDRVALYVDRTDGECAICHKVCDSVTASGICGSCFYPEVHV